MGHKCQGKHNGGSGDGRCKWMGGGSPGREKGELV